VVAAGPLETAKPLSLCTHQHLLAPVLQGVDTEADLLSPKVIESVLGTRLRGRDFTASPLVGGSRNTLAIDADGQVAELLDAPTVSSSIAGTSGIGAAPPWARVYVRRPRGVPVWLQDEFCESAGCAFVHIAIQQACLVPSALGKALTALLAR
jgi:hypothetical protein